MRSRKSWDLGESRFPTRTWSDILDPSTAKVLATYGKGYYAGKPAVTENQAGKGWVYYVGTESKSPFFYDRLISLAAKKSLVALNAKIPPGVEVAVRQKADKKDYLRVELHRHGSNRAARSGLPERLNRQDGTDGCADSRV